MDMENIRAAHDPFANDVLERLIVSNQDYQRAHGHYIVPLAQRLLDARLENDLLVGRLQAVEQERDEWHTQVVRTEEALGRQIERAEEAEARLQAAERERDDAINGRDDLPMAHDILAQLKAAEQQRREIALTWAAADDRAELAEAWVVALETALRDTTSLTEELLHMLEGAQMHGIARKYRERLAELSLSSVPTLTEPSEQT